MSIAEQDSIMSRLKKPETLSIIGAVIILIFLASVCVVVALKFRDGAMLGDEDFGGEDDSLFAEVDKDAPTFDELVNKVEENSDGDAYSGEGPQMFAGYVYEETYDGNMSFNRADEYYDEMASHINEDRTKLSYCATYARDYYKLNRELNETVAVFQKCQPESDVNPYLLFEYYAVMRSLYQTGGDTIKADYYNKLAAEAAPEVIIEDNTGGLEEGGEE